MEMDYSTVLTALGMVAVVVSGLLQFFSTRKARLVYKPSELSDLDIPKKFLVGINKFPLMLSVKTKSNKRAKNIVVDIKTNSPIEYYMVEADEKYTPDLRNNKFIIICIPGLNPTRSFKVFLCCSGLCPTSTLISEVSITHSEGTARRVKGI